MKTLTRIQVGNAPCSWPGSDGFERVLDEVAAAGYAGTELGHWGFMPAEPSRLKRELHARGLRMLGAFVPVALADADAHGACVERAMRAAELLAAVDDEPLLVLSDEICKVPVRHERAGRITRGDGMTERQWGDMVHGTHRVAREVQRRTGVRTAFHHHCASWIETPAEIDRFLRETDPDLVGLTLDTGHYTFAGGDALDAVRKYASRVHHVHLRDCDPRIASKARTQGWDYFASVNNGVFCELGKGAVPFAALADELRAINYSGWVIVEHRPLPGATTPLQNAVRNRAYLREIGL